MPDDPKPLQDTLTAEQKPLFEAALTAASEAAVTKYKTDAEDARKKAIPEKYEFKFTDNSALDPQKDAEKIAAFARTHGFSAEQAAALLKHQEELAGGVVQRQQQFLTDQSLKWRTTIETDKDLGGVNMDRTKANIARVMDKFAPGEAHELRQILNTTGYGNNPAWVRFVDAIGRAMADDPTLLSGAGGPGPKKDMTLAEALYGAAN